MIHIWWSIFDLMMNIIILLIWWSIFDDPYWFDDLYYYWFDDPYFPIFSICFRSSWHLWGDKTQIRYPERSQPVPVGPQNSNLMRCWMPRLSKKSIEKPWKSCWLWLVHANSQIMTILTISGWWFEPLWKILVSWDDYFQYGKIKKCSKPPTRYTRVVLTPSQSGRSKLPRTKLQCSRMWR